MSSWPKQDTWSTPGSRGREIDSMSWWEDLQSHSAQGRAWGSKKSLCASEEEEGVEWWEKGTVFYSYYCFPPQWAIIFWEKNEGCPLRKSRCWLLRVKAPREQEMGKGPEGKRWDTQHLTMSFWKYETHLLTREKFVCGKPRTFFLLRTLFLVKAF